MDGSALVRCETSTRSLGPDVVVVVARAESWRAGNTVDLNRPSAANTHHPDRDTPKAGGPSPAFRRRGSASSPSPSWGVVLLAQPQR